MAKTTMRMTTTARYRGLEVTVLGDVGAGLLAIAGYGTPDELAIAAIAVTRHGGQLVYRVADGSGWTSNLHGVAQAAVLAREARGAS